MAEIFLTVCDACQQDGRPQVAATDTIRLVIDGQPIRLDVCDAHGREFGALLQSFREIGWQDQPNGPQALPGSGRKKAPELLRSPGAAGCPVCFTLLSTPGNMAHHVRKQHQRKPAEWSKDELDRATREARARLAAKLEGEAEGE